MLRVDNRVTFFEFHRLASFLPSPERIRRIGLNPTNGSMQLAASSLALSILVGMRRMQISNIISLLVGKRGNFIFRQSKGHQFFAGTLSRGVLRCPFLFFGHPAHSPFGLIN